MNHHQVPAKPAWRSGGSPLGFRLRSALAGLLIFLAWPALLRAQEQTVQLVATEFPPYTAEKLPEQGAAVAIARAALASQGLKLEVEFRPWARALQELEQGKHDGVVGLWHQPERERFLLYSKRIGLDNLIGFFGPANKPLRPQDLGSLKGSTIGVVTGYANPVRFEQTVLQHGLRVEAVTSDTTNLRKLLAGRIDLVLIDKGVARYLMASQFAGVESPPVWLEPALETTPMYLAAAKARPGAALLRERMDLGLDVIRKSGELERILKAWAHLL